VAHPSPDDGNKPDERETAMDVTVMPRPATQALARPLTGKSAIVTGSTSGIGLGIAR
jgi:hypothetical protein